MKAFGLFRFPSTFGQAQGGSGWMGCPGISFRDAASQAESGCNCWCILLRSGGYLIAWLFLLFWIINLCAGFSVNIIFISEGNGIPKSGISGYD